MPKSQTIAVATQVDPRFCSSELADSLALETKISQADKRARILDARDEELEVHKSRRLIASEELKVIDEKKRMILEKAAAVAHNRAVASDLETERKYQVWLQTVFPTQQAALMHDFISVMQEPALRQLRTKLDQMKTDHRFARWLTIPPLWVPDTNLLLYFGSLPDLDSKLKGPPSRRLVRCSPQLAGFVEHYTPYKKPLTGADPEAALRGLLRACFVGQDKMFQNVLSERLGEL